MLLTEWNWDDAKEVWKKEAGEEKEQENIIKLLKGGLEVDFIARTLEVDKDKVQKLKEQLKQ